MDSLNAMSEPISGLTSGLYAPSGNVLSDSEGQLASRAETEEPARSYRESRRLERFPVAGTRPIALRILPVHEQSPSPWFLADILDVSRGGLCLLISGSHELLSSQLLELDLSSHHAFPWMRTTCEVRWWVGTRDFSTLGLAFAAELQQIPSLEIERRSEPRDPNLAQLVTD